MAEGVARKEGAGLGFGDRSHRAEPLKVSPESRKRGMRGDVIFTHGLISVPVAHYRCLFL